MGREGGGVPNRAQGPGLRMRSEGLVRNVQLDGIKFSAVCFQQC